MKKQLYIRGQVHDAKKIQEYKLTDMPEVKMRGRWYSVPLPLDAEIVEFDPKTLTLTTILPIRGPK